MEEHDMDIVFLSYAANMYWKVAPTDPPTYEIAACPGVSFLSPLLSPALEKMLAARRKDSPDWIVGWLGGVHLLRTDSVAFIIDEPAKFKLANESLVTRLFFKGTPALDVSTWLLSLLRHLSKQTQIPSSADDVNFWEWIKVERLPQISPCFRIKGELSISKSLARTAITRLHIETACKQDLQFRAPVFDGLFLDAVRAHEAHDYRKSILYSAMAAEAAAGASLDEFYEREVRPSSAPDWRTICLPQGEGKTIRKDPVWERLRERDDFTVLLHEAPLYLHRQSLLVDNAPLYQEARILYRTRNKIVHRGEPPLSEGDKYLPIDIEGSSRALCCARGLLRWFDVPDDYPLPEGGFEQVFSTPRQADCFG